ncbi:hypothetical protein RLOC_00003724, partial [Lonchura striata]
MPVPLGVETEVVVTIIPQDFIRQSRIRVRLPELELADGTKTCPFSVQFPEGQNIVLSSDGTANELTCRISFSSSKPMSFLGEMLLIDQEDNSFLPLLPLTQLSEVHLSACRVLIVVIYHSKVMSWKLQTFLCCSHFRLLEQQTIVFSPYTHTWHCTALIKRLSGEA